MTRRRTSVPRLPRGRGGGRGGGGGRRSRVAAGEEEEDARVRAGVPRLSTQRGDVREELHAPRRRHARRGDAWDGLLHHRQCGWAPQVLEEALRGHRVREAFSFARGSRAGAVRQRGRPVLRHDRGGQVREDLRRRKLRHDAHDPSAVRAHRVRVRLPQGRGPAKDRDRRPDGRDTRVRRRVGRRDAGEDRLRAPRHRARDAV